MTAMLRAEGVNVNRKRAQRLMRLMGIAALVRNLTIERANHVWAADISVPQEAA
jgi:putative transposase